MCNIIARRRSTPRITKLHARSNPRGFTCRPDCLTKCATSGDGVILPSIPNAPTATGSNAMSVSTTCSPGTTFGPAKSKAGTVLRIEYIGRRDERVSTAGRHRKRDNPSMDASSTFMASQHFRPAAAVSQLIPPDSGHDRSIVDDDPHRPIGGRSALVGQTPGKDNRVVRTMGLKTGAPRGWCRSTRKPGSDRGGRGVQGCAGEPAGARARASFSTGSSRATGWPWRVMIRLSPWATRSRSRGRCVLASSAGTSAH